MFTSTSTRLLIALALLIYLITPQSEAFWLGGGMGYRRFGKSIRFINKKNFFKLKKMFSNQ